MQSEQMRKTLFLTYQSLYSVIICNQIKSNFYMITAYKKDNYILNIFFLPVFNTAEHGI